MFGQSFILSMALKFLAEKGIAFIEEQGAHLKPQAEAWVKSVVYPDALDPIIWGAINSIWELVMGAAKVIASEVVAGKDISSAIAAALGSLKPHMLAAVEAHSQAEAVSA